MKFKLFLSFFLAIAATLASGCGSVAKLAGLNEKGVVIARRAQIRSSGAVVAADLLEVSRGQTLEILGDETIEGEKWYNVRASDENNTEGWIEARNILSQNLYEQSLKLAEQDKDIPTQATGQLRAASNLRLSPDRTSDDNILLKLQGGDTFEIVGWQRVPKTEDSDEKDDTPKSGANKPANSPQRTKQKDADAPLRLDDKYDTWYKVRLQPSISPAPFGWIYGKQVELTVPADIIFYRTGREFVAWSRIDGETEGNVASFAQNKDAAGKDSKPGSWVILERSNKVEDPNGDEPDFDHISIMGYDKYNQDHYKVYLSPLVKGYLPLRVTGGGDSRAFSVRIKDNEGNIRDFQFSTYKDSRGILKVNVPADLPKEVKR